jgi:hypothetical protein
MDGSRLTCSKAIFSKSPMRMEMGRLRAGRSVDVIRRERVHECARGDMGGMRSM